MTEIEKDEYRKEFSKRLRNHAANCDRDNPCWYYQDLETGAYLLDLLGEENVKLKLQLKQYTENAPLTLDEVRALKSGEVVWIKQEVYLTSQKEIQPVEFYTAMKKQWLFLMIGDFERHGKLYDELNETYFVYRNKPEEEQI